MNINQKRVDIVLTDEAKEVYIWLQKIDQQQRQKGNTNSVQQQVLRSIYDKKNKTTNNLRYGQPIAKNKIPKKYVNKYGITNAYWVPLACGWRMIYSLKGDEKDKTKVFCIVFICCDHKEYDQIFGYKGR